VLLALAAVSSFLWLFWVDHAGQVYKIAGYLGMVLAPRLQASAGGDVLEWELFLRQLEGTDNRTLLTGSAGRRIYIQRATSADWYTALLFGAAPPLLAAAYIETERHLHQSLGTHTWVEVSLVGLVWVLALWRFLAFKRTVRHIGQGIRRLAPTALSPD
jgi:hypothetical protein